MPLLRKNQLIQPGPLSNKIKLVAKKTPTQQCRQAAILYRLDQMAELFLQDRRSQPMPEEQLKTLMPAPMPLYVT
jgi:hypothetical protein